jgi:uncharacterized membrane protein
MESSASKFFTKDEQARIREAIMEAERETSGEIRIHIESHLKGKVLDRAAWIFKKIGMHATGQRNGVLFYLALKNREFAIIGDKGINSKVPDDFWDKTKDLIQHHFRKGEFTDGLVEGILLAGKQLREHFPYQKGDVNELPDEISFDNPE